MNPKPVAERYSSKIHIPWNECTKTYRRWAKIMNTVLKSDKRDTDRGQFVWKVTFRNGIYLFIEFDTGDEASNPIGVITHLYDGEKEFELTADHPPMEELLQKCKGVRINRSVALGDELPKLVVRSVAALVVFTTEGFSFEQIPQIDSDFRVPVDIKKYIAQNVKEDDKYYAFLRKIADFENKPEFVGKTLTEFKAIIEKSYPKVAEWMTDHKFW